jgi:hypothetical protein
VSKLKLKRFAKLSHRIASEAGVIAALIGLLAGIGFFISGFADDFVDDKNKLTQDIGSIQGQVITIQNKLASMETALPIYKKLVGDKGIAALELNRQEATRMLEELQPVYHLSNLRMIVSPTQDMADPQFKKPKVKAIESEITLNFDAVTDEYAIQFLQHAISVLPGEAKVTKINLTSSDLTAAILQSIASTGSAGLVKSEMMLKWRGMRAVEAPAVSVAPLPGAR